MEHAEIWDEEAARRYDTPGIGKFAPEVLGPTVERLRALTGGGRALEMAVSTGRVAVPLAEAGVRVAGIELCQPMIDQLRTKADEELIPIVLGDMTTARVDGSFSLVFLVFNGISNVLTQDRQVAVFENAARHLMLGGRFVIELWVPGRRSLPPGRTASVFAILPGYLAAPQCHSRESGHEVELRRPHVAYPATHSPPLGIPAAYATSSSPRAHPSFSPPTRLPFDQVSTEGITDVRSQD